MGRFALLFSLGNLHSPSGAVRVSFKGKASRSISAFFLQLLYPKCVVSSAILTLRFWEATKGKSNSLYFVEGGECPGLPKSKTQRTFSHAWHLGFC